MFNISSQSEDVITDQQIAVQADNTVPAEQDPNYSYENEEFCAEVSEEEEEEKEVDGEDVSFWVLRI